MVCRLDAWQLNVEQVVSNMETAKQQGQLFAALKAGSAAVTELQKDVSLADVEALMGATAEAQASQDAMQVTPPPPLPPRITCDVHVRLHLLL